MDFATESMQHLLKIFRQAFLLLVSFLDQCSEGGSVQQIKRGVCRYSAKEPAASIKLMMRFLELL
jgi:hypothetical protein